MSEPAREIKPATGTDTVVVGCKAPSGLILRLFEEVERTEVLPSGIRTTHKEYRVTGKAWQVHGPARAIGTDSVKIIHHGAAFTPGVPREVWEKWKAANKGSPLLENRIVWAGKNLEAAIAEGRNLANVTTGLEPLTGAEDRRIPRPKNPDVVGGAFKPGDEE